MMVMMIKYRVSQRTILGALPANAEGPWKNTEQGSTWSDLKSRDSVLMVGLGDDA